MLSRVWNLVLKELIQLWRDKLIIFFVLFGPLLELTLVAYSTSAGIEHLPAAVVDQDRALASRELVTAMENTGTLDIKYYLSDVSEVDSYVGGGRVAAAILIPQGFAKELEDPTTGPPQVQVILDGSDPAAAQMAKEAAEGVVARLMSAGRGSSPPFDIGLRVWFNEELKESNYTTPSELGFMLSGVVVMVASLGIARERELGTLEQLMVTPLRPVEMIVGKAVPAVLLAYTEFWLMFGVSHWGFDVPMKGSYPLLFGLALFYIFVELGWGIMISAVSRTQLQALLTCFVIMMVEMIFSGYAFPVENMPPVLRLLSNLFPIKHWLLVFRAILLKGAGPRAFLEQLVALALLGIAIMSTTILFLRRRQLE